MRLGRVVLMVLIAAIVAAVVAWLALEKAVGTFDQPGIVRDVALEWGEENSALDQRLRSLYPPGTLAETVVADLREQGLVQQGTGQMSKAWGAYPCRYFLNVYWEVGADHRLCAISGEYGAGCV